MADEPPPTPVTAFNFLVEIRLDGRESPLCDASFAECDGLEVSFQPKSYQEGGNNTNQFHLVGPVSYGQLSLKRGMTRHFDLWDWFAETTAASGYGRRADCVVTMRSSDRAEDLVQFHLVRCLPVKIKAPSLNAREGGVAIEELQIAYEWFEVVRPGA